MVCLLACLVSMQGLAAGVIAAVGPSHTHKPMATSLVLEDFRRAPVSVSTLPTHVATAFGHVHDADTPRRHHHSHGDASVVLADGAALQAAGDSEDAGISPSLYVFVALLPSAMTPLPAAPHAATAAHAPWTPQMHCPALPERPPRAFA
jgi:hypothetical protein